MATGNTCRKFCELFVSYASENTYMQTYKHADSNTLTLSGHEVIRSVQFYKKNFDIATLLSSRLALLKLVVNCSSLKQLINFFLFHFVATKFFMVNKDIYLLLLLRNNSITKN